MHERERSILRALQIVGVTGSYQESGVSMTMAQERSKELEGNTPYTQELGFCPQDMAHFINYSIDLEKGCRR